MKDIATKERRIPASLPESSLTETSLDMRSSRGVSRFSVPPYCLTALRVYDCG